MAALGVDAGRLGSGRVSGEALVDPDNVGILDVRGQHGDPAPAELVRHVEALGLPRDPVDVVLEDVNGVGDILVVDYRLPVSSWNRGIFGRDEGTHRQSRSTLSVGTWGRPSRDGFLCLRR